MFHQVDLPECKVSIVVKLECQCGCGRVETTELSTEVLEVAGAGVWDTEKFELAIGLHWGFFRPKFMERIITDDFDYGDSYIAFIGGLEN